MLWPRALLEGHVCFLQPAKRPDVGIIGGRVPFLFADSPLFFLLLH